MQATASFLGVDLGASSGRVMAGHWDGRRFQMEELHRFPNGGVCISDRTYWDALSIWRQMLQGFSPIQRHPPQVSPLARCGCLGR